LLPECGRDSAVFISETLASLRVHAPGAARRALLYGHVAGDTDRESERKREREREKKREKKRDGNESRQKKTRRQEASVLLRNDER